MTELMKRYERETGGSAWFSEINPEINEDYVTWLEAQLTWRPVSEGLPEIGQDVNFILETGRKLGGKYLGELEGFSTPGCGGYIATHWLPIPKM